MIRQNPGGSAPLRNTQPLSAKVLDGNKWATSLGNTPPSDFSPNYLAPADATAIDSGLSTDYISDSVTSMAPTESSPSYQWLDALTQNDTDLTTMSGLGSSQWEQKAKVYLNAEEIQALKKLPTHYCNQIMDIAANTPKGPARALILNNLEKVVNELVQTGKVQFKGRNGRDWELSSLLNVASAVNRLPIAQRKQLAGISFIRAPHPEAPAGLKTGLLSEVAMQSIAAHYDIKEKAVMLYDRGIQESFPALGSALKQSLRTIETASQTPAANTTIGELQKMLNPYLKAMGENTIPEDSRWGSSTERAVRMVQIELLGRYARQTYPLTPQQKSEITELKTLAKSSQFDMISRMTDLHDKMKNLNLLPDPEMQKLLQEFAKSDFGTASLRFLMQDISNDFRSQSEATKVSSGLLPVQKASGNQISRIEEIMTHEMGHHFELGLKNESQYISEFSKLSNWRETDSNNQADGYIKGSYSGEDLLDVYNVLASDGKMDAGLYKPELSPEKRSQKFVTTYASTDPMEDFAESYRTFVLYPKTLLQSSPEKFFFINSLPTIQSRKTGAGAREKAHYQPQEIESMVRQVLLERHHASPTPEHVKSFIRDSFETIMGTHPNQPSLHLDPEVILAIVETHRSLLQRADMPYIPTDRIYKQNNPDNEVFQELNSKTRDLIVSHGQNQAAKQFFQRFESPNQVDQLFPDASDALKKQLKDPSFSSMMLALGQIGGHAYYINQLQNKEMTDNKEYKQAQDFFHTVIKEPSALLSKQTFTQSWNYLRGLSSEVFNPESHQVDATVRFFQRLEDNPAQVFPEYWDKLPNDFKELLQNRRFINAISGDQGRYLPSPENIRKTLQQVMDVQEYEQGLQTLLGGQ